jgi:hypothetical protein
MNAARMTQAEVIEWVKNNHPRPYKKSGQFSYILCTAEEEVISIIDGQEETRNHAAPGDYILTGTRGERFVVKPEAFEKRYRITAPGKAEAQGRCWGNVYEGAAFDFDSPWQEGATIHCEPGDYLVSPNEQFSEAYRVEKQIFEETYQPIVMQ